MLFRYLSIFNYDLNNHLKFINNKAKNIIDGKSEKIDIIKTENINGFNIIINDGYHQIGYINQLFSVFKNTNIFNLLWNFPILMLVKFLEKQI
mgnify:CR=1 FL=1